MRPAGDGCLRIIRSGGMWVALVVSLVFCSAAEAKTHRKHRPFAVVLQPFEAVHTAVHAIAAPVVHELPRALAAVAIEPVRIAVRAARAEPVAVPRGELATDEQTIDYAQPIRVAYVVPRAQPASPPRADAFGETDDSAENFASVPVVEARADRPMVPGDLAVLRNGVAYAPSRAPQSVKNAIWAVNTLRSKPYTWGGGHGSFYDSGYDCSGTISFAMHNAGALNAPISSSEFMRFGERGRGRWITIYARHGHTFAMVAGLRLDTTDFRNGGDEGPRWHIEGRDLRSFEARHPAGM
ncbi:MAG: hypothetical protein M3Z64_05130 [Verrucomicrobiota bacterium]|nr:hypothetical protein [Verrucomicrobiota bacterium]